MSHIVLPSFVHFPTMTYDVNHDRLLITQDFVQHAIVTHTKLVEARQVARQWFLPDAFEIRSQPADTTHDTPPDLLVQLFQFTGGQCPECGRGTWQSLAQFQTLSQIVKGLTALSLGDCLLLA